MTVQGSISTSGTILLGLTIGLIYDVFGRKMPLIIFIIISAIAEAFFPFLRNENELYIAIIFLVPVHIIVTNPFIPDLIDE